MGGLKRREVGLKGLRSEWKIKLKLMASIKGLRLELVERANWNEFMGESW